MKFLVEEATQEVRGNFNFPMDFSISGKFIVDVPDYLSVTAEDNILANLLAKKVTAFKELHPLLPNDLSDEFLTSAWVDTVLSDGYIIGPNKKVALLPSGVLQTTVQTFVPSFSDIFCHFSLFSLYLEPPPIAQDRPGPQRLLYSYDPGLSDFSEPSPSLVQTEIMDSTGAVSLLSVIPDSEQSFPQIGPFSFRLKFTNLSPVKTLFISDWLLLAG